jgi:hypothetical protein
MKDRLLKLWLKKDNRSKSEYILSEVLDFLFIGVVLFPIYELITAKFKFNIYEILFRIVIFSLMGVLMGILKWNIKRKSQNQQ